MSLSTELVQVEGDVGSIDHSVGLTNSYTSADSDTVTLDNVKIMKVGF